MNLGFVIDAVLILIIFFAALNGYLKGFILSVSKIVGMFLGLVIGRFAAFAFAPAVATNFVIPALEKVIPGMGTGKLPAMELILDALSGSGVSGEAIAQLQEMMEHGKITLSAFEKVLRENQITGDVIKIATDQMEALGVITQPTGGLAETISFGLVFFVAFIIVLSVTYIIGMILDRIFDLPVLGLLNKIGGIGSGLVFGLLVVFVISYVCGFIADIAEEVFFISEIREILETSGMLSLFMQSNPLAPIIRP